MRQLGATTVPSLHDGVSDSDSDSESGRAGARLQLERGDRSCQYESDAESVTLLLLQGHYQAPSSRGLRPNRRIDESTRVGKAATPEFESSCRARHCVMMCQRSKSPPLVPEAIPQSAPGCPWCLPSVYEPFAQRFGAA